MKALCFIFLLALLVSCAFTKRPDYCIEPNGFDIEIYGTGITKINQKTILNKIINESNIEYNENSNYFIELRIKTRRHNSLISVNNVVKIQNIDFVTDYRIVDRSSNVVVDYGRIIIIDSIDISDNRFANFATQNYIMENFARNLSIRLENIVKMLLNNKKCKKNQNEVAIYYFDININVEETEGSHYV